MPDRRPKETWKGVVAGDRRGGKGKKKQCSIVQLKRVQKPRNDEPVHKWIQRVDEAGAY